MKFFDWRSFARCLLAAGWTQTTRTWDQTKYDDFEKGTAHGVAISSNGSLTLAPSFTALYTSPSTYIWDIASDTQGNVYAAAGSPARVYRITPDGKARIIFAPQELQVQALAVGQERQRSTPQRLRTARSTRSCTVAPLPARLPRHPTPPPKSPPRRKVRSCRCPGRSREPRSPSIPATAPACFFDPKTKYIWALALDRQGRHLHRHRRSRRNLPRRSQRHRLAFLQERRSADSRAGLRQRRLPVGRHRRQRPGLSHFATGQGVRVCIARRRRKSRRWPSMVPATSTRPEWERSAGAQLRLLPRAPPQPRAALASCWPTGGTPAKRLQVTPLESGANAGASPIVPAVPNLANLGGSEIYRTGTRRLAQDLVVLTVRIWSMRWHSIVRGSCWQARVIAARSMPSARMSTPIWPSQRQPGDRLCAQF